jgi:antitoxin PrlF
VTTLKVNARREVTLTKDILRHLGISPGQSVVVHKLSHGRIALEAKRSTRGIEKFIGLLAGMTSKVATLEEIKNASGPKTPKATSRSKLILDRKSREARRVVRGGGSFKRSLQVSSSGKTRGPTAPSSAGT